jgi:hypothetical protein
VGIATFLEKGDTALISPFLLGCCLGIIGFAPMEFMGRDRGNSLSGKTNAPNSLYKLRIFYRKLSSKMHGTTDNRPIRRRDQLS